METQVAIEIQRRMFYIEKTIWAQNISQTSNYIITDDRYNSKLQKDLLKCFIVIR